MMNYEYEINISPTDVDEYSTEIWGAALLWVDDKRGVDYNLSYDNGYNCSAIYKCFINDEGNMEDDTSIYMHYEIDFGNDNWQEKLITAMKRAAHKFHGIQGGYEYEV